MSAWSGSRSKTYKERTCGCGERFSPTGGRQNRCDGCRARAIWARLVARPGRQPPSTEAVLAPDPAERLERALGDLEALRRGAEAILRRHAGDASPYGRGLQSAALTLLNAAGFSRHPSELRYAGRDEMRGLEAEGAAWAAE